LKSTWNKEPQAVISEEPETAPEKERGAAPAGESEKVALHTRPALSVSPARRFARTIVYSQCFKAFVVCMHIRLFLPFERQANFCGDPLHIPVSQRRINNLRKEDCETLLEKYKPY
jgi:hypothetical protein